MNEVLKQIGEIGIVPVVVLDDAKDAEPLARALREGGLPCAEVTFRTDAAEESIRIMSERFPDMLVGAGTVLTTEQVDRAVAAGAKSVLCRERDPDHTGLRQSQRRGTGYRERSRSREVLPG